MNTFFEQAKPVLILLVVCGALIGGIVWVMNMDAESENGDGLTTEIEEPQLVEELQDYEVDIKNNMNPVAILNTNKGIIEIELFEDVMPITAGNFVNLAEKDFYNQTKFHRVIDGFMIQGGDPNTKTDEVLTYGRGGPGYSIPDEHIKAAHLTNTRGTISMANSGPESGGSQFFINLINNDRLDFDKQPLSSKHPVFGRVVSGMEVVDAIAGVEINPTNLPLEDVVIQSVEIRKG